jgi:hypothetical protein
LGDIGPLVAEWWFVLPISLFTYALYFYFGYRTYIDSRRRAAHLTARYLWSRFGRGQQVRERPFAGVGVPAWPDLSETNRDTSP